MNGDLFELARGHVLVLTTNGTVKSASGEAVMGRGCAHQAKVLWPDVPRLLGSELQLRGNHVHLLGIDRGGYRALVSFPVKHNWWEHADLELIRRSAQQLVVKADVCGWQTNVFLPRPGAGNGKLLWATVKDVIAPILDDRFIAVDF